MWQKLVAIKVILWVLLIGCAVFLLGFFSWTSILASSAPESTSIDNQIQADANNTSLQLEIKQVNSHLRATSIDGEVANWQYVGPNITAVCNSTVFTTPNQVIRAGREVSLEPKDYDKYYCFRASKASEYGYKVHLVLKEAPFISINQSLNEEGQVILKASSSQELNNWQHFGPKADNDCRAETFTEENIQEGNLIAVDQAELTNLDILTNDAYYCFRAQSDSDTWIYNFYLLQFARLQFDWQRQADQLLVEITNADDSSGEYVAKQDLNTDCSLEDFANSSNIIYGNSISIETETDTPVEAAYCFRAKDQLGAYHYEGYLLEDF